jgi:hypothetical protein
MDGRVSWRGDETEIAERLGQWQEAGATHVTVNTMGAGFTSVDEHLDALATIARVARSVTS